MPRSFMLHNGPVAPDPAGMALRLAPYETGYTTWNSGRTTLWTNGSDPIQPVFQGKGPEFFLFGEEPADYHKEAVARFLETGVSALSDYELHGAWIVLEGDALYLYNGRLGETPVYYCRGASDLLIATEIKALAGQRVVPVRLMAVEDMAALPYFPDASITLAGSMVTSGMSRISSRPDRPAGFIASASAITGSGNSSGMPCW